MQKIDLSEEDAEHIKDWQRLAPEEKEALNKMAKYFGSEDRRKSLYAMIETQAKVNSILTTVGHLGWFGQMFFKASAIALALISFATLFKLYILGGK